MMAGESHEGRMGVNEVRGDVFGGLIQARNVHGDIHYHSVRQRLPSPSQLPPSGRLINRADDLAALQSVRSSCEVAKTPCVIVVNGPAGIGKTALALHWLRSVTDDYPDGQFYADLQAHAPSMPRMPGDVIGQFLRALNVPSEQVPDDIFERQTLFRSLTSGRRIAMLLDDALSAAQVRPLLPANPSSLTVVTSRWRLAGLIATGARGIQLDRLDPAAAVDLLEHVVGDGRTAQQRDAALELVRLCALFPLAVCVAGARLASRPRWSIGEMVEALAEEQRRLPTLAAEEDVAMESSLDFSYERLPASAQRVYRLAALYAGGTFESHLIATALEISSSEARSSLNILADAHLIEDTETGRYRFHDLIRLHARRWAERDESADARATVSTRVIHYLLAMATAAERRLTPDHQTLPRHVGDIEPMAFASDEAALQWLEEERTNLMPALHWAAHTDLPAAAWQLADAMWPLFRLKKYYDDWIAAYDVGLEAARDCGHPEAESRMLTSGGLGLMGAGRLEDGKARFVAALAINRRIGDVRAEGGTLTYLGIVSRRSDRHEEAKEYFSRALECCRSAQHLRGVGLVHLNLGEIALVSTDPHEAIVHLGQAHRDLTEVRDKYDAARALAFLGRAYHMTGDLKRAVQCLREALTEFEDVGSGYEEAYALESLGDIARQASDFVEARALWDRALNTYERLPIPSTHVERVRRRLASS